MHNLSQACDYLQTRTPEKQLSCLSPHPESLSHTAEGDALPADADFLLTLQS